MFIGTLILLGIFFLASLWVLCKAASDADDAAEERKDETD